MTNGLWTASCAQVERVTNHDVKAIEYVLKKRFAADAQLSKVLSCGLDADASSTAFVLPWPVIELFPSLPLSKSGGM